MFKSAAVQITLSIIAMSRMPAAAASQGALAAPTYLRCEYLINPLGIDETAPRLSWEMVDPRRGAVQTAYQILAADNPADLEKDTGNLCDTGKVKSDQSIQIVYAGKPLASRTRVWWKVRVWDKADQPSPWSKPARWSMGLLAPADWSAKWIGDPAEPPPMIRAHNGYHSQLATAADTQKWITIDLGQSTKIDAIKLFPASPFDWKVDAPGFLFPVRFRIELSDSADFGIATTVVDDTALDIPNPGNEPQAYKFDPTSGRYVRLTATRLAQRDPGEHGFALAEMQVLAAGTNVALRKPVSVGTRKNEKGEATPDSIEQNNWSTRNLVNGDLTSHRASGLDPLPPPMLRKTFSVPESPIKSATAYVTALGLYELRINGKRVGDHLLAPEWTNYHKRIQYQTYDVTDMVRAGENVVAAQLADGWYAGRIGLSFIVPDGPPRRIYGPRPELLLQLEIERADGSRQTIVTDESWRFTTDGPIRSSDMLDGETCDARRDMPGWDSPGFDDSKWQPAKAFDPPAAKVVAQMNEPIRLTAELKPIALAEPKPGVFVFDLGQNIVGSCRLVTHGEPGQTITLRHAEVLRPDGMIFTENLRSAAATDRFTLAGSSKEVFQPRYTYHGFRYVEVTGLTEKPQLEMLTGRAFNSSSPEISRFECSNPMLNKLVQNILWTQRGNMESVPTDCPQRDERLGWMGDILAFAQTACFNMDMAAFYTKFIPDIREAQADDGRYADFSPHPFGQNERFTGTPAWGDAGLVVPWRAYINYGDTRLLENHFDSAQRWVDWIHSKNPDLLWKNNRHNDYGDWLTADTFKIEGFPKKGADTPHDVFATLFFAHSAELLSRMAAVIGRPDDEAKYRKLSTDIKNAFCKAYMKPDGRIEGNTQGGYALALRFNVVPVDLRPALVKHMLAGFEPYKGHLSTGFHSTGPLMLELTRNGHNDAAYRLATNRTMPSWGYPIDNGATTIWERWDGYVEGKGFQDAGMNSFSHYAFGAVAEWMFRTIGGINPDEEPRASARADSGQPATSRAGYKHIIIHPQPGGDIIWAKTEYRSIHGKIATDWKKTGSAFTLEVTIPPNTTATVYVPATDPQSVNESGTPAGNAEGVEFLSMDRGAAMYRIGAGNYLFASKTAR